jgi:hypothetical protein
LPPLAEPDIFHLAPRKNKLQLTIALNMLSNINLAKPYKLFFLGAGENRKLGVHCLLLLLYVRILLLPILLLLLLALFLVDFSQKIWYNHGIVGGSKARHKLPSFLLINLYL